MVDRISSLPDELICHILSFLPTKEAICTSGLSKRWKPLWLFVSTLHFKDGNYLHDKDTCFGFFDNVHACIAAIQHKVEHLDLTLPSTIRLPFGIFTSATLVVLKLTGLTVESVSSVSFPSLKTLHLTSVRFREHLYIFEILSACPVLEDLLTNSLKYFNFCTNRELKRLSKLVRADVYGDIPVASFCNVEFLRLQVVLWTTVYEIHTFLNLTYMELIFDCRRLNWLIKLLHHSPSLQILVVKGNLYSADDGDYDEEIWEDPKLVPECFSSKLKKCFVQKFDGGIDELEFARYIMENAKVLQALIITSDSYTVSSEEKNEMITELLSWQRISVECELFFDDIPLGFICTQQ